MRLMAESRFLSIRGDTGAGRLARRSACVKIVCVELDRLRAPPILNCGVILRPGSGLARTVANSELAL